MAIGVFGLQVAYRLKRLEVMSTANTHGWFGGGSSPAKVSTVDRIDFSNDTGIANIRSPLSLARNYFAATGNSNYGWFGGGIDTGGPLVSLVDRIDFSNDSSTASVRGPLSAVKGYLSGATGNSNYGWFGGGKYGIPPSIPVVPVSTVDRIDFSNDSSSASPRSSLSSARYGAAATGNSNYGWFGGGINPPASGVYSTIDRVDFSNDFATVSVRGPLFTAKSELSATGNSNYGWFGGGQISTPALVSTVERIDFSNDSVSASVRGSLSLGKRRLAATGNSNYGWFGGGNVPSAVSTVDRIDFSNDSTSVSVRGPLSAARYLLAATSGQAKGPAIKLQKAGNYGWFGGGYLPQFPSPNPIVYATVNRIDFSNDSVTGSTRGSLSLARGFLASTGNSNYGWFGGGYYVAFPSPFVGGTSASIDRINFSNDSATASVRGSFTTTKQNLAATGNSNYGWFGGGSLNSGIIATVDRINFANDSVSASPRGSLFTARSNLAATGNSNYGWFGGGGTPTSTATVDRIDFSNDSSTASVRGSFTTTKQNLAATGNSNYGWFGGGVNPTPAVVSTVDRINFANDSSTASPRGPLSLARYQLAATGNSNYGWFGGGATASATGSEVATVDRIDFSNDSVTALVRGGVGVPLRRGMAATSNRTR